MHMASRILAQPRVEETFVAEERVHRRLAAILAADVVGYSRLMGENEEGTLAALTAHLKELIEPCIAEHRGRVGTCQRL